jgi:copper chaperone CopZ
MKTNKKNIILGVFIMLFLSLSLIVQSQSIKNAVTETFKVSGNCGMCEKTIEKAANKKGLVKADWDVDKKSLQITYNSKKTNSEEILKRVAYAGYDNAKYKAPDEAYANLHECCKYERSNTKQIASENQNDHSQHIKEASENKVVEQKKTNPLEQTYSLYFLLKDALVKDDGSLASLKSKELLSELNSVKMEALGGKEHAAFMKYFADLKTDVGHIAETKDISSQRERFTNLSENMYELMKVAKPPYTIYLDNCPMFNDGKGANWISKESSIKNPYYGSQMLTCGKIKETLK